jgi:hypothetical protein
MQRNSPSGIRRIKSEFINRDRWDSLVGMAPNSRVYAMSWYLDLVADEWEALVWDDYAYVMPLPVKRRFGILKPVQPCYCQQLGIFPDAPADIKAILLTYLETNFSVFGLSFNSQNELPQRWRSKTMVNFLLHLDFPYKGLYGQYTSHTRRQLRKSLSNQLTFGEGIDTMEYIRFKKQSQPAQVYGRCLPVFKRLSAALMYKGTGTFYGVYTAENELCAAAFFVYHGKRLIYLNGVSNQKGKANGAMFFLFDQIIQRYAESKLFLDFEGSMNPGIARFFSGFGAQEEIYHHCRYNTLPIPFKWLF